MEPAIVHGVFVKFFWTLNWKGNDANWIVGLRSRLASNSGKKIIAQKLANQNLSSSSSSTNLVMMMKPGLKMECVMNTASKRKTQHMHTCVSVCGMWALAEAKCAIFLLSGLSASSHAQPLSSPSKWLTLLPEREIKRENSHFSSSLPPCLMKWDWEASDTWTARAKVFLVKKSLPYVHWQTDAVTWY